MTDIEEFREMSSKDFKQKTTRELRELIHDAENHVLDEYGKFDWDDLYDEDGDLAEQMDRVYAVIQNRTMVAHTATADDLWNAVESIRESLDGQQTAIDRLKRHGHDGGVETGKVTYPGKRDN